MLLVVGVALGLLLRLILVGNRHHAHQVGGQIRVVRADLVRLVKGPLIRHLVLHHRCPGLVKNCIGVRTMAQHRDHRHQHRQNRHGQRHRHHHPIMLRVLRVFLQLLHFIRFH